MAVFEAIKENLLCGPCLKFVLNFILVTSNMRYFASAPLSYRARGPYIPINGIENIFKKVGINS